MKKYGYSSTSEGVPHASPNQNIGFLLQELAMESQWEKEQEAQEQEATISEDVTDTQAELKSNIPEKSSGQPLTETHLSIPCVYTEMRPSVSHDKVRTAYGVPSPGRGSLSANDKKYILDKKA